MPFNGSGVFSLIYSWVADRNAGIDISSTRMDTQEADIATGLTDCITRDGQSLPTANLPMGGFRHTGAGNGVLRADYTVMGQTQDGVINWAIAAGTADAITATYTPALTALVDGQLCFVRALQSNATTTPTFAPNGLTAHTITKLGGTALAVGDIAGALAELILRYNLANTRWELLNPSNTSIINGVSSTGDVKFTFKTVADSGWLIFDDGTFGSASSGSSNSNSAANQSLFTLFYNNISDTNAPVLTSAGSATTRASQGTAAQAWAANCRMTLTKTLGRALGFAGAGSGLTSRALGAIIGNETATLITANLPPYTPSGSVALTSASGSGSNLYGWPGTGSFNVPTTGGGTVVAASAMLLINSAAITFSGSAQGGTSTAFSLMQPTSFMNAMVKQ